VQHWPASIWLICRSVATAVSSAQTQKILQPVRVFSNRISHRGTTQQPGAAAGIGVWVVMSVIDCAA
jgi:hypothetical protein